MKLQATSLAVLASVLLASSPVHAAASKMVKASAKPAASATRTPAEKVAVKPAAPAADPLAPLSSADITAYKAAFAAAEKGDETKMTAALAKISNPSLKGRVAYAALVRKGEKPAFADLKTWLASYGDEAGADRVYDLALKAKPRKAKAPAQPALVRNLGRPDAAADKSFAARDAYYSGDVRKALTLALPIGEHWIAGLASYRLDHFADARVQFAALAHDKTADPWLRSAAAFWAGRSAALAGSSHEVKDYLLVAAQAPQTFYGMIAERQLALLGVEAPGFDPIGDLLAKASNPGPEISETARFAASEARTRRAAALAQLGRLTDAGDELRAGLAMAKSEKARDGWMSLSVALNPQIRVGRAPMVLPSVLRRIDASAYPLPALEPQGGFTIDPALVYALVRQESGFNPAAVSPVGAIGLMQLMPNTAAAAAGDDKLKEDITPLFEPAVNLRIGQDYFSWLMQRSLGDNDLLRAVAAYNGGPGTLVKVMQQLGADCDSLLLIESLPAQETRNYVEKVTAAYWTYRKLFGLPSGTLDALANGSRNADIRLDPRAEPIAPIVPTVAAEASARGPTA